MIEETRFRENLRLFLLFLLFFIFSIVLGGYLGLFIANFSYCLIESDICSGYNDGWMIYFWGLGIVLLNILFYFSHKERYNKILKK